MRYASRDLPAEALKLHNNTSTAKKKPRLTFHNRKITGLLMRSLREEKRTLGFIVFANRRNESDSTARRLIRPANLVWHAPSGALSLTYVTHRYVKKDINQPIAGYHHGPTAANSNLFFLALVCPTLRNRRPDPSSGNTP